MQILRFLFYLVKKYATISNNVHLAVHFLQLGERVTKFGRLWDGRLGWAQKINHILRMSLMGDP